MISLGTCFVVAGDERNALIKELKTVMLEYCDLDCGWKLENIILNDIEKSLAEEWNINKIDEVSFV